MAVSAVFGDNGTLYEAHDTLISNSGAKAAIVSSAKLEGPLSGVQLDINDLAFTTQKKCLGDLRTLTAELLNVSLVRWR